MVYYGQGEKMILEKIREALINSDESRNKISKATGVDNAVLCRIVHGGSCSIKTAEVLCKYLGLELQPKQPRKKRR